MKISFSTLACPDYSWAEIYSMAKDIGFDGIEVRGLGNDIFAVKAKPFTESQLPQTVKKLKELGLTIPVGGGKTWLFDHPRSRMLFTEESMRQLSFRWYDHEEFRQYGYQKGMERVYDGLDALFASLGYEHERYSGRYRVTRSNQERVALFAHRGFGLTFLSCLLDIPFPQYCAHYDMSHTGMTVIEFKEQDGYAIPKVLTHSSDSHLYREGLPTQYDYGPWF